MQGQRIETRLGKTRKERAFLLHIPATVALDASAKWRFIQDNLNVHCSASLVKWIAKREGIKAKDLGNKGHSGILKDQASRRVFLAETEKRAAAGVNFLVAEVVRLQRSPRKRNSHEFRYQRLHSLAETRR